MVGESQRRVSQSESHCQANQKTLNRFLVRDSDSFRILAYPVFPDLNGFSLFFGVIQLPSDFCEENSDWDDKTEDKPVIDEFQVRRLRKALRYTLLWKKMPKKQS